MAATSRTASTLSACSWPSFGATTLLAGGLATGYADMVPLTICRLTMAVVFGLGTGAVFKLVALGVPGSGRRRDRCGGCHGGLSASSPPLLMEFVKSVTGTYTVGFVLLAVTSRLCLLILLRMGSTAARPATTAASMR